MIKELKSRKKDQNRYRKRILEIKLWCRSFGKWSRKIELRVFHIVGTLLTVYAQFIRQPGAYEYLFNSLQSCQIESLLFFPRFSLTKVTFLFFTSIFFLSVQFINFFFLSIPKYWEKSRITRFNATIVSNVSSKKVN